MARNLAHIVAAMFTQPWLVHAAKAQVLSGVVLRRAAGVRLLEDDLDDDVEDAIDERRRRQLAADEANRRGGVAVIPVLGTLVHRGTADNSSGLTSTEVIARKLRAAEADPNVSTIILDIDSPGGEAMGTPELGARLAASPKTTVAVANAWAASAAYWLASQADELVVTPSGEVGSIGAVIVHEDVSEQLKQEGVKVTVVRAPAAKYEGNPFEPLGPEALAELQAKADASYEAFVSAVARGRGVPRSVVAEKFGQGRMVDAEEAVARGMADRVATLDETVARFLAGGRVARRRATAPGRAPSDLVWRERDAAL